MRVESKKKEEEKLKAEIKEKLKKKFGKKIEKIKRLSGGINNIYYKVILSDGNQLFVKKYYKDERERLEREYRAIKFFEKLKLFQVPRPYFSDKKIYFAVYDFISGEVKKPHDVGKKDILDLVDYTVKLHSIKPTKSVKKEYGRDAVLPVFSLQDHVNNLHFKFGRFMDYYSSLPRDNKLKKRIDAFGFISRVRVALDKVTEPLPKSELEKKIKESFRRFNHIDFGFHNVIYKRDSGREVPYFTDYELSGWDDPYRMLGDFMTHELNKTIPQKLRNVYLDEYKRRMNLDSVERTRLDITVSLMDIEWVATYLWSIAPEKVDLRSKSIKGFNLRIYLKGQLAKTEERLLKLKKSRLTD